MRAPVFRGLSFCKALAINEVMAKDQETPKVLINCLKFSLVSVIIVVKLCCRRLLAPRQQQVPWSKGKATSFGGKALGLLRPAA
jgi:hypothetical protein